MIKYQMKFQPLQEIVCFIELYVNHNAEYKKLDRYCKTDEESQMVQELRVLCQEVGEAFLTTYSEHVGLFTYINPDKGITAINSLLFGECDYRVEDPYLQLQQLKEFYMENPRRFLEEIITSEKEQRIDQHCSEEVFLKQFDELLLSDEIKWKLWRIQHQLPAIFDLLEAIVKSLLGIIEQHQALYDVFLVMFQQEMEEALPHNGLYEHLTQLVGVFNHSDEVVLFPTLAGCRSINFCDREEGIDYIIYGIGNYRSLVSDTSISDDTLCSNLKLLSDKSKFDILRFLSKGKAYGAQIASELKLSTPTISHHMQALLCAQLVTYERDNTKLYYKVNEEHLRSFLKQVEERLLEKS